MGRTAIRSVLVLMFLFLCGTLGLLLGQRTGAFAPSSESELSDSLRLFTQVLNLVEENYAEPVNTEKAIYRGAIPGMLRGLDPHSNFFAPGAYTQLREEQRGSYFGIGARVGMNNNRVIIDTPFVGSPAYRAGLRPGDIIIAVDGSSAENLSTGDPADRLKNVADRLKGPKGTKVRVTVLREGNPGPVEFSLVRDEIPLRSVDLSFLARPGEGYIRISQFKETTSSEVQLALEQLGEIKGLVLDLRNNPGGSLREVVAVTDRFLSKGAVIVSQQGRSSPETFHRAMHGNGGKDYPIVVLVNRYSASASEILAGAIQDHDRGLVAGETTFGKGLVQAVFPLAENSGLALTTARFYTPSGRLIQRNYNGLSLFDYYFHRENGDDANREVKFTDSGRIVYGGGGITPDVKLQSVKATRLQEKILQKYALFNFAKDYAAKHRITSSFEVDDTVLQEFRQFLAHQKVTFAEAEFRQISDWLTANIKAELFIDAVGEQPGLKLRAESDPQVQKAFELLPHARDLAEQARKVTAQRRAAREPNQ